MNLKIMKKLLKSYQNKYKKMNNTPMCALIRETIFATKIVNYSKIAGALTFASH